MSDISPRCEVMFIYIYFFNFKASQVNWFCCCCLSTLHLVHQTVQKMHLKAIYNQHYDVSQTNNNELVHFNLCKLNSELVHVKCVLPHYWPLCTLCVFTSLHMQAMNIYFNKVLLGWYQVWTWWLVRSFNPVSWTLHLTVSVLQWLTLPYVWQVSSPQSSLQQISEHWELRF